MRAFYDVIIQKAGQNSNVELQYVRVGWVLFGYYFDMSYNEAVLWIYGMFNMCLAIRKTKISIKKILFFPFC